MRKLVALLCALALVGCAPRRSLMDCFEEAARIPYVNEPEKRDHWQSPAQTRARGTGDCEDKSFLLQEQLYKNGFDARVVFGRQNPEDKDKHAWVETDIDGVDYILDPTVGLILRRGKFKGLYIPIKDDSVRHIFVMEKLKRYKLIHQIDYQINLFYEETSQKLQKIREEHMGLGSKAEKVIK